MKNLWKVFIRWLAQEEISEEVRKSKEVIIQRDKLKEKIRNMQNVMRKI